MIQALGQSTKNSSPSHILGLWIRGSLPDREEPQSSDHCKQYTELPDCDDSYDRWSQQKGYKERSAHSPTPLTVWGHTEECGASAWTKHSCNKQFLWSLYWFWVLLIRKWGAEQTQVQNGRCVWDPLRLCSCTFKESEHCWQEGQNTGWRWGNWVLRSREVGGLMSQ